MSFQKGQSLSVEKNVELNVKFSFVQDGNFARISRLRTICTVRNLASEKNGNSCYVITLI